MTNFRTGPPRPVLALAVAVGLAAGLVYGTATGSEAAPRKVTKYATLKTDSVPTIVGASVQAGKVTCVRARATYGRTRGVVVSVGGHAEYARLTANSATDCLLVGAPVPAGASITIRVREYVPVVWDPTATASLRY